jgi:hypothetical protein
MLTDQQLTLITAAIDRELTGPEWVALQQLLSVSSEARQLYAQLADDSRRIRRLSWREMPVPPDVSERIRARIAALPAGSQRPIAIAPPVTTPAGSGSGRAVWQHLVPIAVAASVLFAVTMASFAVFSQTERLKTKTRILAQQAPLRGEAPIVPKPSPTESPPARPPGPGTSEEPATSPPVGPMPKEVPPQPTVAMAPEPRLVARDLIGSQILPALPPFERVEVRLPFLHPVADLPRDDVRQSLLDEVQSSLATRFDLFVRDTARGVDVFEKAAAAMGLKLYVDSATRDKLKKKQLHSVVVYTDALTAAEIAQLFSKIASEDQQFSPRVCDSLHALPAGRQDEMELKALMGIDPRLFKRPSEKTNSGFTTPKPAVTAPVQHLSEKTIDMVTDNLTKSAERARDKSAVLLTWQTIHPSIPRTPPAASAELKQFLQKRGESDPLATPILIIIRPVG